MIGFGNRTYAVFALVYVLFIVAMVASTDPVFGLIMAAPIVVPLVIWWILRRRRIRELAALAERLRLQFSVADPLDLARTKFPLLRRGTGRLVENVLWGRHEGMQVRLFDLAVYRESDKESPGMKMRTTRRFSCAMTTTDADCPPLGIARESLLTKTAHGIGVHDIAFESEAFNQRFWVRGKDRRFANAFVDARMMRWLLEGTEELGFETAGTWLLTYSKRRRPAVPPTCRSCSRASARSANRSPASFSISIL